MDFLVPNFIKYQLYLLQLENYELGRYWQLLRARGFLPSGKRPLRKELVWTAKAKALLLMAVAMHFLVIIIAGLATMITRPGWDNLLTAMVIALLALLPLYFVLFSVALFVIRPLDTAVKQRLVNQANLKIKKYKDLKIIGIAGSYGKTTMKEVLRSVLSSKYLVLSPAESVNTPVGIARFILNKVNDGTRVLILEFGEHYRGDVKELCEIAPPDIVVLTGVNEAHLERMKSLDNIAATIFEAAEAAKSEALVVMNGDDERLVKNYQRHTGGREVRFYSAGQGRTDYLVSSQKFDPQELGWNFDVQHHGEFAVPLLGEYAIGAAVGSLAVGEYLGLSATDIKVGLSQVRPIEHRLQPMPSTADVLVIDDSYNGNPAGVTEAINILSKFENRRKIYITPGLVETGSGAARIHHQIGHQLANAADIVILIKDSVTPYIAEGIMEAGQKKVSGQGLQVEVLEKPQIIWFDSALVMHEGLKNIIQPGDVVLFQNDWGDQYV